METVPPDVERQVVEQIDPGQIASDLVELVSYPSEGGTPAEVEVQAWCAQRLHSIGMKVDHWEFDLDTLADEPTFPGQEVRRREAWGCAGVSPHMGPVERPALILNGHVDVAPLGAIELWEGRDPWALETFDTKWWGRGAGDMKGGLAAILGAADAVRRAGIPLKRPFAIHTVVGAEDGGLGTYATLRRGHVGDTCVIAKPTADHIMAATAGALTFHLTITGEAAHGATPCYGVSALEKFDVVRDALRAIEDVRSEEAHPLFASGDRPWAISIGAVRSGDWASSVPDWLVAEGRYGVLPGESLREAKALFKSTLKDICDADLWLREHPVDVRWVGGHFASTQFPAGHHLLDDLAQAAIDSYAPKPGLAGAPFGSDMRLYHAWSIPTLLYGPGDIRYSHAVAEHVGIESVFQAAQTYARLIARLCT